MSHFIGLVFGSNIEELLEPYNEDLEVEPYVKFTKDEAVNEVRERRIQQYEYALSEKPKYENSEPDNEHWKAIQRVIEEGIYISYEDAWEVAKRWGYEIDDEENLLSTYNTDAKWDWYCEGGRWDGFLPVVNKDENDEPMYEDFAYKFEVDWNTFFAEDKVPFCFVTEDGEWHEAASMGWWGMTTNDKEGEDWKREFVEYLNSVPEDIKITVIDFHI